MIDGQTTAVPAGLRASAEAVRLVQRRGPTADAVESGLDRAGICVGLFCAGHCAIAACVPAVLPFVAQSSAAGSRVESLVFVSSCVLAGLAGANGFRRHGRRWIVGLFILSAGLLLASRCLEELYELLSGAAVVALLGGFGMASGHLANQRCSRGRGQCCASATSAEAAGS